MAPRPADSGALFVLDCDEVWAARHWTYARHGYAFTTSRAQDYFSSATGYSRNPLVTEKTIGNYLTQTDASNRDIIVSAESGNGCRE